MAGSAHHGTAMTYDEIAARMGISRQGVMLIERDAMRKIRENADAREVMEWFKQKAHEEAVTDSSVNVSLRFAKSQRSK